MLFVESSVRDGIYRIRNHYREEGFIDVLVKSPAPAFNENRSGVTITIAIEEGPQYIITDVQLNGDLVPELAPELEKIKNDLRGKPYFVRRKLFCAPPWKMPMTLSAMPMPTLKSRWCRRMNPGG